MRSEQAALPPEKLLTRSEMLAGLSLFLLAAFAVAGAYLPGPLYFFTIPVILASGVAVFFLGIRRGLPRWFLPYPGTIYAIVIFFAISIPASAVVGALLMPIRRTGGEDRRLLLGAIQSGIFWICLAAVTLLLILFLQDRQPFRSLAKRLKGDWSQVSFLFYGAMPLSIFLNFDEYRYEEPYLIGSMIFLAIGAWGYLASASRARRIAWLLAGLALAMGAVALGKWLIVPLQNWPVWFGWHPPQVERRFEALGTVFECGWMLLALLAPALIRFTPAQGEAGLGDAS